MYRTFIDPSAQPLFGAIGDRNFFLLYVTSSLQKLPELIEADLLKCLGSSRFDIRDRILSSAVELIDNAERHGCSELKLARFGVGIDQKGIFIECSSVVDEERFRSVAEYVERLRTLSSHEIAAEEVEISTRNLGTDNSGLGLLHVARYSATNEGENELIVLPSDYHGDQCLTVRSYLSLSPREEVTHAA